MCKWKVWAVVYNTLNPKEQTAIEEGACVIQHQVVFELNRDVPEHIRTVPEHILNRDVPEHIRTGRHTFDGLLNVTARLSACHSDAACVIVMSL